MPILVWKYWLNREVFVKKFKEFFNLGNDDEGQTENFIRIYLENEDETFEDIRYRNIGFEFNKYHIYS